MAVPAVLARIVLGKALGGIGGDDQPSKKSPIAFSVQKGPEWDAELRRLKATPKAIDKAIFRELIRMGVGIRNTSIVSMRKTPRTGRRYRATKNKNKYHIASSPGYPPAVNTGDLIKSIKMDVRVNEIEVGSNITKPKYPRWLEEGTKFMDARPWLEPAYEIEKRKFYVGVRRNVNQAIRNAK